MTSAEKAMIVKFNTMSDNLFLAQSQVDQTILILESYLKFLVAKWWRSSSESIYLSYSTICLKPKSLLLYLKIVSSKLFDFGLIKSHRSNQINVLAHTFPTLKGF